MTLTRSTKSARPLDRFNSPDFIQRLKDGDQYAFSELNKDLVHILTNHVLDRYRNSEYPLCIEDAEDIAQEVMLKINRSVQGGGYAEMEEAKFTTWIFTLANNAASTRHRQLKRRKEISLEGFSVGETGRTSLSAREEQKRAGGRNVDNAIVAHLDDPAKGFDVMETLRSLEGRYHDVIILVYMYGYSPEEVAQYARVPVNTVHQWLTRARKQFKRAYVKL